MSRIGKKIIPLPQGVSATITGSLVTINGPKGELTREIHHAISIRMEEGSLFIFPKESRATRMDKKVSALWGLTRSLVANMVQGVHAGFEKKLVFEGVGYRVAAEQGKAFVMQLGFSHPVRFDAPKGITLAVEKNTITVSGYDKEMVGQVAAEIRDLKKPEPYKGKGIRYIAEIIKRKAGKKAVASAG